MNKKLCGLEGGIFGCGKPPCLGWDEKRRWQKHQAHRDGVADFMKAASGLYPHEHGPLSLAKITEAGAETDRILGNFLIDNMFLKRTYVCVCVLS